MLHYDSDFNEEIHLPSSSKDQISLYTISEITLVASIGDLEEESFVNIQFEGKKACTPYHNVGKVVNHQGEDSWNIRYFRHFFDGPSSQYVSLKEPTNPDFFITNSNAILKQLPEPKIIKDIALSQGQDKQFNFALNC